MQVFFTDTAGALNSAKQHAAAGQFDEMLSIIRQLRLNVMGAGWSCADLLSSYGFITEARSCYQEVLASSPGDLRAMANLAYLAHLAGDQAESRRIFTHLLQLFPDHPVIRRNALTAMEYDPEVTDYERLQQANAWGDWAMVRAGGKRDRPPLSPLGGRVLRIGYVSADFCQHTVGLFVKNVLKMHDPARVQVFAYSAGDVNDWVTTEIGGFCHLSLVSALDDVALADKIRADRIDVLVDLSGHTAGSRLTTFAHRPAPVMVSWLGYFATTGLPVMDAVLLDEWHAPPGVEAQFREQLIRLPRGRFCYQPLPWTPAEVAPPPVERNGFISFGSFNNNAKYNGRVFDAWARILTALPQSRLILKWRNFNDETLKQEIRQAFVERKIDEARIELRGPSFHADLLNEYADVDIALDPFPFTGGLTSCEALWMGVPVITCPQSRVVSRQTHALLNQIGLPEFSAKDTDDYVRIAVELAGDIQRIKDLRQGLRDKMLISPLMDGPGFARQVEDALIDLYRRLEESSRAI